MDVRKLKAAMVLRNMNADQLAEVIGINKTTFYRRLRSGGKDFTQGEICSMIEALNMSKQETFDIFFADQVS